MRTACIATILLLTIVTTGFADVLVGTNNTNYGWIGGWTANRNGHPYWDGDGDLPGNVGQCVAGTAACFAGAPGVIPYWGRTDYTSDTGGTPDMDISFNRTAGLSGATLRIEIAGNAGGNELGWYNIGGPLQFHPIFPGPAGAGASALFTPTAQYGFYLKSDGGFLGTFFTQANRNVSTWDTTHDQTTMQHFAVFQEAGSEAYWIGIEDLPPLNTDRDYNDMVFRVAPVPEPSAVILFGTVALAGVLIRRRRKTE